MTTPYEVNLGWGVRLSKEKFLGKHSLTEVKEKKLRKMVGFQCSAGIRSDVDECNLIIEKRNIIGRVTSVSYSPYCKATIGLAMIDSEFPIENGTIEIKNSSGVAVPGMIIELPFYDPKNTRQSKNSLKDSI